MTEQEPSSPILYDLPPHMLAVDVQAGFDRMKWKIKDSARHHGYFNGMASVEENIDKCAQFELAGLAYDWFLQGIAYARQCIFQAGTWEDEEREWIDEEYQAGYERGRTGKDIYE